MSTGLYENNALCSMLGIEYPIIQGGMAWVADAQLAAAVSNAGGLGIVAAMSMNSEQLREEIQKTRKLTDKPFGVNIMLMSPHAAEVAKTVVEEGIKVVTTGAGNPGIYMEDWLSAGIKVIPVVPSVGHARRVERSGATAVIAEGGEAGGHVGDTTTMCLVPQVCDAVSIPVIAAGGIADGRGIAAAIMLGAVGVQVGTRFLSAIECNIHPEYKRRVLKASDIDTIVTGKRLGHPVRALKSMFTKKYFGFEYDSSVSNDELEAMGAGSLRKAVKDGDIDGGSFMAGQIAGLVKEEQSVLEIIEDMFNGAEEVLRSAAKRLR